MGSGCFSIASPHRARCPRSPPVATISDKPTELNPHDLVRMAAEFNSQKKTVQDLVGDMKVTGGELAEEAAEDEPPNSSSASYGCECPTASSLPHAAS